MTAGADQERPGLLLVNLGTPDRPDPPAVRRYLREFLSDPRVIDLPTWRRWLLLNLVILPFRPRRSAEAYAKIWTQRGSPLLVHGQELAAKLQQRLGSRAAVELGMRYGQPSIPAALERLRSQGVSRVVVFPLYPQYSSASTGSTLERVFACAGKLWNVPYLQVVPPFYGHPAFIDACVEIARPHLDRLRTERVFFSFHGLPERHVLKGDESGAHCLRTEGCCGTIVAANRSCYRAHCVATATLIADRLQIPHEQRIICFQSRLGRDPWIRPYTDEVVAQQARKGVKQALILSPAFVADCLETLEELGIRAAASWRENGGQHLEVVPCLNATDVWVDALMTIAGQPDAWLSPPEGAPAGETGGIRMSSRG